MSKYTYEQQSFSPNTPTDPFDLIAKFNDFGKQGYWICNHNVGTKPSGVVHSTGKEFLIIELQVFLAKDTESPHTHYEYKQFVDKCLATEKYDVFEKLNEYGQDGWLLYNLEIVQEPSGIKTESGEELARNVYAFTCSKKHTEII